jgi:hypothetical protein
MAKDRAGPCRVVEELTTRLLSKRVPIFRRASSTSGCHYDNVRMHLAKGAILRPTRGQHGPRWGLRGSGFRVAQNTVPNGCGRLASVYTHIFSVSVHTRVVPSLLESNMQRADLQLPALPCHADQTVVELGVDVGMLLAALLSFLSRSRLPFIIAAGNWMCSSQVDAQ